MAIPKVAGVEIPLCVETERQRRKNRTSLKKCYVKLFCLYKVEYTDRSSVISGYGQTNRRHAWPLRCSKRLGDRHGCSGYAIFL